MAKKLNFKVNDKVSVNGAQFLIVSIRNGNVMMRPQGGYDMEGEVMTLRQPVLMEEEKKKSWSKKSEEEVIEDLEE